MTLAPKMEILGQISERARAVEGAGDPMVAFSTAMFDLGVAASRAADRRCLRVRDAAELVAACAVNWLVAHDAMAATPGGGR
jgi:hypothetical protein